MNEVCISVNFRLKAHDMLSFNRWHHYQRTLVGRTCFWFSILAFAMFLVVNLRPPHNWQISFHDSLYLLIPPGIFLVLIPVSAILQFKRLEAAVPGMYQMHYEFSPERIRVSSKSYTGEEHWNAYQTVIETPTHLFFYLSPLQARILPKRELPEKDVEQLRTMLRECLENGKFVQKL